MRHTFRERDISYHIHTCIHAAREADTYTRSYIQYARAAYANTYIHTGSERRQSRHTYIQGHACILYTYKHTYTHTHAYIHIYIQAGASIHPSIPASTHTWPYTITRATGCT